MPEKTKAATEKGYIQKHGAENKAEGKIQVRIFSLKSGLQIYDKALMIHVRNKSSSLLIMEDYLPIIGMVDGSIVITWADDEMTLDGIKGFYCHEHNSFFLLLKESSNVG